MSDLVSRLLAAIDETERLAQDATTRPGGHEWTIVESSAYAWGEDDHDTEVIARGKPIIRCDYERGGYLIASHIAHNDPAAVLRRCAADKAVLKEHAGTEVASLDHSTWGQEYIACRTCAVGPRMVVFPCPTVKHLAAGYGISVEEETTGE